jgi:hypothetical protein
MVHPVLKEWGGLWSYLGSQTKTDGCGFGIGRLHSEWLGYVKG